ncbi:MAG: hypothetical protein K2O14_10970 [Oscillospiraceae bacterium]|nr:hypothetical protein [Oscillospiraceae bacterium]
MTKAERAKYFNPDGSIKRLLEIVETLPDGTSVFENGWKAEPSMVDFGGERGLVRLDSMTKEERDEWETNLMKRVGKAMSEYYQSLETGAGKYMK